MQVHNISDALGVRQDVALPNGWNLAAGASVDYPDDTSLLTKSALLHVGDLPKWVTKKRAPVVDASPASASVPPPEKKPKFSPKKKAKKGFTKKDR